MEPFQDVTTFAQIEKQAAGSKLKQPEKKRRRSKIAARCFVYYVKQNRDIIWSFNF